jgi:hypothetical protein
MDLFLQPQVSFEKASMASTRMPEDPNAWPQEVLQQLYKEVPYISDFSPHVVMDKVDAEKGYAFGHITVMNRTETQMDSTPGANAAAGIRQVRVPIVIKGGELFPLDLLITDDSKVLPLTESRLRAAIFRPQAFDVTAKTPGDQSMIGQLYPPYRQNFGFGGGGVAMNMGVDKESSALMQFLAPEPAKEKKASAEPLKIEKLSSGSLLKAISQTINDSDVEHFKGALWDPNVRLAYEKNAAAVVHSVSKILNLSGSRSKLASVMHQLLRPTIRQVTKLASGYLVKTANHQCWAPQVETLNRTEAIQKLGSKLVLAADTAGSAMEVEGVSPPPPPEADSDMQELAPVTKFGLYKVQTTEGQELTGYVIPNLFDVDGTQLPVSLFSNGSHGAIQSDILGVHVEGDSAGLPTADAPNGYGAFFKVNGDEVLATIPMTVSGSFEPAQGEPSVLQGETYDGRPVEVSVQPNIQAVTGVEGRMLVPIDWQWLPLSQSEAVDLVSSEHNPPAKEAAARRMLASVEVVSGGETFSVRGPAVEKLASAEREFLDLDAAMFLLAGLGVDSDYTIRKLGESMAGREPVQIKVGRYIKRAEEQAKEASARAELMLQRTPSLRRDLIKEAGFVTDPEAVDTMLSLGFINPENVTTFIGYMPTIEKTQESLCNLLFASRVGLSDIPTPALETAVRSTEEVLEGLKTMAFQGPAEYAS